MGGSKAQEGHAAFDVGPEVVGVGDVEVARVFGAVAVVVADERCLVVVVEVSVAGTCKLRNEALRNVATHLTVT